MDISIDEGDAFAAVKSQWELIKRICKGGILSDKQIGTVTHAFMNIVIKLAEEINENVGPILIYFISENIMHSFIIFTAHFSLTRPDFEEPLRICHLHCYEHLLSHATGNEPLLYPEICAPLIKLVSSCTLTTRVMRSLSVLINHIVSRMNKNALLFKNFMSPPPAILQLLRVVIPMTYEDGVIGQQSQDAFLLLMQLSRKSRELSNIIVHQTDACAVLASGLNAMYSQLPTNLKVNDEYWSGFTANDCREILLLDKFINCLMFFADAVQISNELISQCLIHYFYYGFLLPVMAPALIQKSSEDSALTTAYFELFLRKVRNKVILRAFIKFILTASIDDKLMINVIIQRLYGVTKLSRISLNLICSLLELNNEEIMFHLIFQYLYRFENSVCYGIASQNLDLLCEKILSFIPTYHNARSRRNNEKQYNASSHSDQFENFESSYSTYIEAAKQAIRNCKKSCDTWSSKNDSPVHARPPSPSNVDHPQCANNPEPRISLISSNDLSEKKQNSYYQLIFDDDYDTESECEKRFPEVLEQTESCLKSLCSCLETLEKSFIEHNDVSSEPVPQSESIMNCDVDVCEKDGDGVASKDAQSSDFADTIKTSNVAGSHDASGHSDEAVAIIHELCQRIASGESGSTKNLHPFEENVNCIDVTVSDTLSQIVASACVGDVLRSNLVSSSIPDDIIEDSARCLCDIMYQIEHYLSERQCVRSTSDNANDVCNTCKSLLDELNNNVDAIFRNSSSQAGFVKFLDSLPTPCRSVCSTSIHVPKDSDSSSIADTGVLQQQLDDDFEGSLKSVSSKASMERPVLSDGGRQLTLGPLLQVLLVNLEDMMLHPVTYNLFLTKALSRIVAYPHSIIHSILFHANLSPMFGIKSMYEILLSLKKRCEEANEHFVNFESMINAAIQQFHYAEINHQGTAIPFDEYVTVKNLHHHFRDSGLKAKISNFIWRFRSKSVGAVDMKQIAQRNNRYESSDRRIGYSSKAYITACNSVIFVEFLKELSALLHVHYSIKCI